MDPSGRRRCSRRCDGRTLAKPDSTRGRPQPRSRAATTGSIRAARSPCRRTTRSSCGGSGSRTSPDGAEPFPRQATPRSSWPPRVPTRRTRRSASFSSKPGSTRRSTRSSRPAARARPAIRRHGSSIWRACPTRPPPNSPTRPTGCASSAAVAARSTPRRCPATPRCRAARVRCSMPWLPSALRSPSKPELHSPSTGSPASPSRMTRARRLRASTGTPNRRSAFSSRQAPTGKPRCRGSRRAMPMGCSTSAWQRRSSMPARRCAATRASSRRTAAGNRACGVSESPAISPWW